MRLWILHYDPRPIGVLRNVMTLDEIERAAVAGDLALLAMAVAWLLAARPRRLSTPPNKCSTLNLAPQTARGVAVVTLLLGVIGLRSFGYGIQDPLVDGGLWSGFSLFQSSPAWSLQSAAIMTYFSGLRPWLCVLIIALVPLTVAGTARFATITALAFIAFAQLSRGNRRWFPRWMPIVGLAGGLCFLPLKIIGEWLRSDQPVAELQDHLRNFRQEVLIGDSGGGDTQFLDMAASYMTLADQQQRFSYGRQWLTVLSLPIPRQLWPDKPRLTAYLWELGTPERPMHFIGLTTTLFGDGYLAFGWVGVVLIPGVVAYGYGRMYFWAIRHRHDSLPRFIYVVMLAFFIQVCRDGVLSVITFPLTAAFPFLAVVAAHTLLTQILRLGVSRRHRGAPLSEIQARRNSVVPLTDVASDLQARGRTVLFGNRSSVISATSREFRA